MAQLQVDQEDKHDRRQPAWTKPAEEKAGGPGQAAACQAQGNGHRANDEKARKGKDSPVPAPVLQGIGQHDRSEGEKGQKGQKLAFCLTEALHLAACPAGDHPECTPRREGRYEAVPAHHQSRYISADCECDGADPFEFRADRILAVRPFQRFPDQPAEDHAGRRTQHDLLGDEAGPGNSFGTLIAR